MTNTEVKNKPICKCHDYPMLWKTDSRRKKGGYWICHINEKDRERDRNMDVFRQIYKRKWQLRLLRKRIVQQLEELNVR
jgi:hypothetical protein